MAYTPEDRFKDLLHTKLGDRYDRAFEIYKKYGPELGREMVNVLRTAADTCPDRLDEVLTQLVEHWQSYLVHQPRNVSQHRTALGANPTDDMYMRIMRHTLGVQFPGSSST